MPVHAHKVKSEDALDYPKFSAANDNPKSKTGHYRESAAFLRARNNLDPFERGIVDEMSKRYKKEGNEEAVKAAARELGKTCGMGKTKAASALLALVEKGFLIRTFESSYEHNKNRRPSEYQLTWFPYRGSDPLNNFIEDPMEWRRIPRRRKPIPEAKTNRLMERLIRTLEAQSPQSAKMWENRGYSPRSGL